MKALRAAMILAVIRRKAGARIQLWYELVAPSSFDYTGWIVDGRRLTASGLPKIALRKESRPCNRDSETDSRLLTPDSRFLKLPVLCEGIAGQALPLGTAQHLHPDGIGCSSAGIGLAQDGELGKNFVIELGYQIILATLVIAPHLSELDGFHCHCSLLPKLRVASLERQSQ